MRQLIDGLKNIDVKDRISQIETELKQATNPRTVDTLVKELKILRNLDADGMSPYEAYTRKKMPIIPAMYRSPAELSNGSIRLPDINLLVRDVAAANQALANAKKYKLPEEDIDEATKVLYQSLEQLSGFDPPTANRKVTHNAFTTIAGKNSPKEGFAQKNLFRKRQDLSARSTLTPNPNLGIDEVEIPKDIGYSIYEPFVKKELYSLGYGKDKVEELINNNAPEAFHALKKAGKERPILINRAPSIRNTSVNALWPVFTDSKNIGVPNLLAGLNPSMDFDGDSCITMIDIHLRFENQGILAGFRSFLDRIMLFGLSCLSIIKGDDIMKLIPTKISRVVSLFKYLVFGRGSIFIGDIPYIREPESVKMNRYGGKNIKYRAYPGQYCKALTKDMKMSEQEITHFSVHENIPLYEVKTYYIKTKSIYLSPLNSIIVCNDGTWERADLTENNDTGQKYLGAHVPIYKHGKIILDTIVSIKDTGMNVTMYDISMGEHHTFLTGEGIFLYDTAAIHVPVTSRGIEDSMKLLPSNNIRWEPTGSILTGPEHSAATGLYLLSKTAEGRKRINEVLPPKYAISKATTKPELHNILRDIDKYKDGEAGRIMEKLREMGDEYIYERGHSIGIDDISPRKDIRDKYINLLEDSLRNVDKNDKAAITKIYDKISLDAVKELEREYTKNESDPGNMMLSKSRGNPTQFRDVVLTPFATKYEETTTPIKHGYGEGLDPWEYWLTTHGARKGIISRSQETALPGALASELLSTVNQLVIGVDKTKNMKSIEIPTSEPFDLLDRYISQDIEKNGKVIITKDSVVTPDILRVAKMNGLKKLPVYTVMGSSAPNGALPSYGYGLNKDNKLMGIGENIGVNSAHAVVVPLFTGSLKSFHTGGSSGETESGYPRIKQLLELQKSLPRQATVSAEDGKIDNIREDSLTGHHITINGKDHYVSPNNNVRVKIGDKVSKGDPLSDGPIQPAELAKYKGLPAAQEYMVNELKSNVPSASRRSLEVLVEGITRYGKITDPGSTKYLPGDIALISAIEEENENTADKAEYEVVFKGVNQLPQATQGWLSQLGFRNIKRVLAKNIGEGAEEEIHSYSPLISIAHGNEFGEGEDGKY
jgi:hypothetical protein